MKHKRLGFMQLTIIVGFSLYYAAYLIMFFGLFTAVPADDFAATHAGQVVFFIGNIIATIGILALLHKRDGAEFGRKHFLYLASLVPGLAMPLCFALSGAGIAVAQPLFQISCLLSGFSVAFGFMLWEDIATHGFQNRGVLAHGTIFCAGGVLFVASTLFLEPLARSAASVVLLCGSTALLAFIAARCDTLEDKPVAPARDYFKTVWNIDVVVVVITMAFGYAFILLYWKNDMTLLVVMGVAILVDAVFTAFMGRGKWMQFTGVVRICAAIVSCALILLVCPGDVARDVALCTVIMFWFLFRTMNGGALTDLANRCNYSMLYSSLRGKLPANVGFTIGLALGIAALQSPNPSVATLYVPLGMVAAFILSALFLLPFEGDSATAGYKTLALVDMHEPRETGMKKTCELAVKRFKLSPRESEVLDYLVKGRNAKHISEKLFISESTAKTHISNIYRKLGVHSQQELLDALDNME